MATIQKFKQILKQIGKLALVIVFLLPIISKQEAAHAVGRAKSLFGSNTDNSAYTTGALSEWL
jgi:hypothetical protein